MIFEHSRFEVWNRAQHPYRHTLAEFGYSSPTMPGVTNVESALNWIMAVLYPNNKASVANVAALPASGNTLNDYRVVLDDGDGKTAGYRWEQREGEGSASWHKIFDVDWSTDSILAAFIDQTQPYYVKQGGKSDLDDAGAVITGLYAGQTVFGGDTASQNLTLKANSGDGVGAQTGYVQVDDNFRPAVHNTWDLGTTTERWKDGWFQGTVTIGAASLVLTAGSITDTSGAISFGDENLTTTGNITGAVVTGSSLVADDTSNIVTIVPGSYTDASGTISFGSSALNTTGPLGAGVTTLTETGVLYTNTHSLSFPGSESINIPYNATYFAQTNNISAFLWMNTSTVATQELFSHYDYGTSNRRWAIGIRPGQELEVKISTDGSSSNFKQYASSGFSLQDGSWHHVGFTFATNTLKIYIDGVEITGGSLTKTVDATVNTLHVSTASLKLGAIQTSGTATFEYTGLADEWTYWDKTLSNSEVTELYNSGTVFDYTTHTANANLIEWWKIDGSTLPTVNGVINSQDGTSSGSITKSTTVPAGAGGGSATLVFDPSGPGGRACITSSLGAIDFIDEDLYTTGTLSVGAVTSTQVNADNLRLDGNTLSSTDTNGNILLVPDGTGIVDIQKALTTLGITATGTVGVTGQLNADNLRLDGNTLSSTDTDGNIVLSPDGTGIIQPTKDIVPSGSLDLGASGSLFVDLHISGSILNATNTFSIANLMAFRNSNSGASSGDVLFWSGTEWLPSAPDTEIDHGSLAGILDDDHTQYMLLGGRSGGQSLVGGTDASDDLTLESTSNVTKGFIKTKDDLVPFTDASYSAGWSGTDLGDASFNFRDLYMKGEARGLRLENFTSGTLPSASAQNIGRTVFATDNNKAYVDTGTSFIVLGVSKFLSDTVWNGSDTSKDVTVSATITDARNAVWALHDNTNDFDRIYCSLKAISATQVRITVSPALPSGSYRLIGIE